MPRIILVIESEVSRGRGLAEDPYRAVVLYHTLDGKLLAERDRWAEERASKAVQERPDKEQE